MIIEVKLTFDEVRPFQKFKLEKGNRDCTYVKIPHTTDKKYVDWYAFYYWYKDCKNGYYTELKPDDVCIVSGKDWNEDDAEWLERMQELKKGE